MFFFISSAIPWSMVPWSVISSLAEESRPGAIRSDCVGDEWTCPGLGQVQGTRWR